MFPTARDPVLSLRSAAAAVTREHPASDGLSAVAGRLAMGVPQPPHDCVTLGLELLRASVAGDAARQGVLLDRLRYSPCDPLWAKTLLDYVGHLMSDGAVAPVPCLRHATLDDFVAKAHRADLRIALFSAHVEIGALHGVHSHGFVTLDCGVDAIEASYWALTSPEEPVHRSVLGVAQS